MPEIVFAEDEDVEYIPDGGPDAADVENAVSVVAVAEGALLVAMTIVLICCVDTGLPIVAGSVSIVELDVVEVPNRVAVIVRTVSG